MPLVFALQCILYMLNNKESNKSQSGRRGSGIMSFFFPANYVLFFGELCRMPGMAFHLQYL